MGTDAVPLHEFHQFARSVWESAHAWLCHQSASTEETPWHVFGLEEFLLIRAIRVLPSAWFGLRERVGVISAQ